MKLGNLLQRLKWMYTPGIYYIGGNEFLPPPLKGEEEQLALEALKRGDTSAKQQLVEHNLRLVVYIARRFENPATSLEDFISIGSYPFECS